MNTSIVHPDMITSLDRFFTKTCTIQEFTYSSDKYNAQKKTWKDKHRNVKCAVGEDTQQEIKQEDKTIRNSTHRIILQGVYDVTELDRVKIDDNYYDILLATEGMQGEKTSLICEKVVI